jgi:hypothetical protein
MEYPEKNVVVTQVVELVPGQSRRLDTVLVRYTLHNQSDRPHKLGLRFLLDTYIGTNDGVPFCIPGRPDFLETMEEFDLKHMPAYVQAWERMDLKDPGTIAHLGLKGIDIPGVELEPIDRMRICRWPGHRDQGWEWPMRPINDREEDKDSCVVLDWKDREMAAGEKRELAFIYGLNAISSAGRTNPVMGLTAGGSFRKGGEFTLTAIAKNPQPGQKAKLTLPKGLELASEQSAEQELKSGSGHTLVSWRVISTAVGQYTIEVMSGALREAQRVSIAPGAAPVPRPPAPSDGSAAAYDPTGGYRFVYFGPDGPRVVLRLNDDKQKQYFARVYDLSTGKAITPLIKQDGVVLRAWFSPDGTRVVTSGDVDAKTGGACVWDAGTGRPLSPPLKQGRAVWHATFSPDSKRVVTTTYETARLWGAQTGQELKKVTITPD